MDMRKYIISNFKGDSKEEIKSSIDTSIASKEEEPLIGLGILFELAWKEANDELKENILVSIENGLEH